MVCAETARNLLGNIFLASADCFNWAALFAFDLFCFFRRGSPGPVLSLVREIFEMTSRAIRYIVDLLRIGLEFIVYNREGSECF